MEDNSFDPRSWIGARDDAPHPGGVRDAAGRFSAMPPRKIFPLATEAALRLWLTSTLVLAIAAGGAWAMRRPTDAAAPRLAVDPAAGPADHAQAPAP